MTGVVILSPETDPTHQRAHSLVRDGWVTEARVETKDGHCLFRAWIVGPDSYAWQTSQMAAPAFWERLRVG